MKWLLLGLIAGFVWLAWKRSQHRSGEANPASRPAERKVVCAHCGVHLPEGEAETAGGVYYCCAAHRSAGPGRR